MFFLERGDFDDGSLDSLVPLSSRPHLLSNLNLNEKLLMPRVRVLVNVKVQKMSKEDLEGRTSGIFVFWLFVEFCVVHTLGGCIRMITDDGPLSPQPCHDASHACHQGAHFTHSVLCSTSRSVDQVLSTFRSFVYNAHIFLKLDGFQIHIKSIIEQQSFDSYLL